MKKTFLLLACVAFLFTANAQEGGFKQAAGDKALELNFAPLGGSPFSIGGLQFKSYSSETSAIRLNVFIAKMSETKITQNADADADPEDLELKDKTSSLEIGLRPGIEKHFAGTDRLSPYMGAEIDFAIKSSSKKEESQMADKDGKNNDLYTKTTKGEDGFMRIGVNAFAGFDYFFAKKLYVGAELGFGFSMKNKSVVKVTDEAAAELADRMDADYKGVPDAKQGGTMNIGPNVIPQIRVGFLF